MRTIIGAIVVALGFAAAQPAFAGEGAAPAGAALLLTVAPIAVEKDAIATTATNSPFRLGLTQTLTPATDKNASLLHHRLGTGMVDFYTAGGDTGFHLSAGSRLFARRNFAAETAASSRGLIAAPVALVTGTTTRLGYKKFNPALTAGYSIAMSKVAKIGVEAGAMMSGAFSSTPGLSRFGAGYRGDHEFRPDAIANMVFGLRF